MSTKRRKNFTMQKRKQKYQIRKKFMCKLKEYIYSRNKTKQRKKVSPFPFFSLLKLEWKIKTKKIC